MEIDGDNTYPGCERCGRCCEINALCMTEADYRRIQAAISDRGISPVDYGGERCCFQLPDRTCMLWDARPQVCRLHNCHVPRKALLAENPQLHVDEDLWLVDLRENFVLRENR